MKRSLALAAILMAALAVSAQTEKPADCAAMMQDHQSMQKQMGDMDAKLNALVADMNAATGQARIDKMAAVINELVAQRAAMQKQIADMQPAMMHQMMEHMQGGKESMDDCPMMKDGKDSAAHQHN